MRIILRILLLFSLAVFYSCEKQAFEEQGLFVDCSKCETGEILKTSIDVLLDENPSGTALQLWEGNIEDSILVSTINVFYSTFTYYVTVNKKYTITATYLISGNKYIAVDSATPKVKFIKNKCDDPCYFTYDRVCDLRLRHTK
jgi:hypothetical protein